MFEALGQVPISFSPDARCKRTFHAFILSQVGGAGLHGGGDHGVSDAGVAAGGVDDDFVGREAVGVFALEDHVEGGAILDGAAGVEVFGFCLDFDVGKVIGNAFEL